MQYSVVPFETQSVPQPQVGYVTSPQPQMVSNIAALAPYSELLITNTTSRSGNKYGKTFTYEITTLLNQQLFMVEHAYRAGKYSTRFHDHSQTMFEIEYPQTCCFRPPHAITSNQSVFGYLKHSVNCCSYNEILSSDKQRKYSLLSSIKASCSCMWPLYCVASFAGMMCGGLAFRGPNKTYLVPPDLDPTCLGGPASSVLQDLGYIEVSAKQKYIVHYKLPMILICVLFHIVEKWNFGEANHLCKISRQFWHRVKGKRVGCRCIITTIYILIQRKKEGIICTLLTTKTT